MQLTQITDGQILSAAEYDLLICCGQPARVGHATEILPEAGAVCDTCRCLVVSIRCYGPTRFTPCAWHQS